MSDKWVVVDTGVPLVANGQANEEVGNASPACVMACTRVLHEITQNGGLVLDSLGEIVEEYGHKLLKKGQRGPGDEFLIWVFTHQWNPAKCERVAITRNNPAPPYFDEFPRSEGLRQFDPSDCKFVATANAHPAKPPILVSVDSDWAFAKTALEDAGIKVHELCPKDLAALAARRRCGST
jgi:hypothetical protein